jgi:hypothetical protein
MAHVCAGGAGPKLMFGAFISGCGLAFYLGYLNRA